MASPPHESPTLSSYLGLDEELDCGSDTDVHGNKWTLSNLPVSEVRTLSATNPFVERGETTASMVQHHAADAGEHIVTNLLDEQQKLILQQEKTARGRAQNNKVINSHSGYVFSTPDVEERLRQMESRSLLTCSIRPEATSPEDMAFRQAQQERYFEPFMTTQGQYKAHLESPARGISVRPIMDVPILLFTRKVV